MWRMSCRTPDTDDCERRRGRREYAAVNSMGHRIPAKQKEITQLDNVQAMLRSQIADWRAKRVNYLLGSARLGLDRLCSRSSAK